MRDSRSTRHRGDIELLCWGRLWVGEIAELAGDGEAAFGHVREALEVPERISAPFARVFARVGLARAHLLRASWNDGARSAGEALAISREHRTGLEFEARSLASLAEAQLGTGDPALAQRTATEAIATTERHGTLLGEIFARVALAKALEPIVRVELANLARLRGDEAGQERELRAAHRLFLEIGAPLRAEQIEREIAK